MITVEHFRDESLTRFCEKEKAGTRLQLFRLESHSPAKISNFILFFFFDVVVNGMLRIATACPEFLLALSLSPVSCRS